MEILMNFLEYMGAVGVVLLVAVPAVIFMLGHVAIDDWQRKKAGLPRTVGLATA
jgi:hypothetical protein